MKVLFIGLGSIAQKHLHALRLCNPEASIYGLRSSKNANTIDGVINIYDWSEIPKDLTFILISNPTSEHYQTIEKALKFKVPLFIEKPPFSSLNNVSVLLNKVKEAQIPTYTAFNMRFHPCVQWLKNNMNNKRILEVNVYCGSYLPNWRPNADYRKVYSSIAALGGGVHLDLIHELDYLVWIFGLPNSIQSLKRKVSDLEIDSVDVAKYWLEFNQTTASISLNYFRKDTKRSVEIVTDQTTIYADLVKGEIIDIAREEILFSAKVNPTDTYVAQMQYFLNQLNNEENFMNNIEESSETLKLCLS